VPGLAHLLSGRIASAVRVAGGALSHIAPNRLVKMTLTATLARDIELSAVEAHSLQLTTELATTLDLKADIR